MYKIRVERDFIQFATNGQSDKAFLLGSKFWPQGIVCPCPGILKETWTLKYLNYFTQEFENQPEMHEKYDYGLQHWTGNRVSLNLGQGCVRGVTSSSFSHDQKFGCCISKGSRFQTVSKCAILEIIDFEPIPVTHFGLNFKLLLS